VHAEKRILERRLTKTEVEEALERPLQVMDTKHGRRAAIRTRPDGGYTIVIFEGNHENLIVVTAMKTNSDGAKRFGFTRI
jgi:hypothetical protein